MTSRRLFFRLIAQDFKKRIWCPIILFIAFFLSLEVNLMVKIENIVDKPWIYSYDKVTYFNTYFLGAGNTLDLFAVVVVAAVCAISGFSYLHSRTQIDTYHSMPVKRITLFLSKYFTGFLIFADAYVVNMFISLLVGKSKGCYTSESIMNMMLGMGVKVMIFLVVYSASIMAICLTGNIVISFIAVVILNVYSAVMNELIEELFFDFMLTFNEYGYKGVWAFSPLSMIVNMFTVNSYNGIEVYEYSYLPKILLGVAVYTILAAILYIKRSSESAGHAIAFKWAEPIVKTMCVIPVALFSGMFFSSLINDDSSRKWFIFGMVFGYVIVAILMEVIFRMDIKGAFKHKKQFVFNAACVALIFIIFRYDVLGYNTYVPNDSELQSCSVSLGLFRSGYAYGITTDGIIYDGSDREYKLENMEIKGNPSVTELARKLATEELDNDNGDYVIIYYAYNFINGKKVYRQYYVYPDDSEVMKLVADVFNDNNYKASSLPIFEYGWKTDYDTICCYGKYNMDEAELSSELKNKILEAYQTDYMNLDCDTVLNTYPLGYFVMSDYSDGNGYNYSDNLIVYPSFTNTIQVFRENGFDFEYDITADDVKSMTFDHYEMITRNETSYGSMTVESNIVVTDSDQINEILDNIENYRFEWEIGNYTDFLEYDYSSEDYYEISIKLYDDINDELSTYMFRKGCVPEFMSELGK